MQHNSVSNQPSMLLGPGMRIVFFICTTVICFLIASLTVGFISQRWGVESTKAMRICAVIQDVIMFIIPAIITSMMVSRQPARLLCIDRFAPAGVQLLTLELLIVMIPAMNYVIHLNADMSLPAGMHELEQMMRDAEASAAHAVEVLQGGTGIGDLVMSILIVGIMAGVSEELFFRAGLQRLLTTGGVGPHAAVWIVAAVFSLLHFQMFGFVPRMLLGALFGYLLVWSGSVWLPALAHVINNSLYVIVRWVALRNGADTETVDNFGVGNVLLIVVSAALSALIIYYIRRTLARRAVSQTACGGK